MDAKEFIREKSGFEGGVGYELSFDEMGLTPKSFERSAGKVAFKTPLTDYFRKAKRRARAQNPIAPNQADIVQWIIYDRFQFAAGTVIPNNFKFFTQPIGQGGKTEVDTNMEQVQRLPDPQWFNATGLGFWFGILTSPADIDAFLNSEYVQFWVGQKSYMMGPAQCFPGGAGISAALAGTGATQVLSNGQPRIDNVFDLRLPAGLHLGNDTQGAPMLTDGLLGVTILQGQQFRVECNAPAGGAALSTGTATPPGTGLTVMCYLYGILSRGVQ